VNPAVADALAKLLERTDGLLWDAFAAADRGALPSAGSRMVFPRYSSGSIRASEQEARFFFVRALEESAFFYSVEMPTVKLYKQSGASPSRASFDVTVLHDATRPVANCEFKFGGVSPERKDRTSIAKDLEKLLRDPGDGVWFHLLAAADNSTLLKLLETIRGELSTLLKRYSTEIDPKTITVHVCVLRHGFSIHRDVAIDPRADVHGLTKQLTMSYQVTRNQLTHCTDTDGWQIFRRHAS
jgi:hypothetical protein